MLSFQKVLLPLFFIFLCLFSFYVNGQEEESTYEDESTYDGESNKQEEETTQDQSDIESSPYVSCDYIFPRYPDKKLISGEAVELLVGVTNTGMGTYNLTKITASLRHPMDFRYHLKNFTKKEYSVVLGPYEQTSLSYTFHPEMLEARDFGFVANVHYQDEGGRNYVTTFFNETIDLAEPESTIDAQTFFTYSGILAALGLIGFVASKFYTAQQKKKSKDEYKGRQDQRDSDWLAGINNKKKDLRRKTKS